MALARAQTDGPGSPAVAAVGALGDDGAAVVSLRGEHDLATVDTIAGLLADAVASSDADLVIDLSEVEFMDASTIAVLRRCRALLESRSRAMTLRAPSTSAQRVLDLCRITTSPRGSVGERGNPEAGDGPS